MVIWKVKMKYIFMLSCLCLFCLVMFYVFLSPENGVTNVNKADFLSKKRNHRTKNIDEDHVKQLVDMSDKEDFKAKLQPLLVKRVPGTEEHKNVQKYIKGLMKRLGWDIEEDSFTDNTPFGEKEFNNIIATQNKYLPRKLTLACHYDSKYFDNINFIGATDSAVPCAMLLDLADKLNDLLFNSPTKVSDISLQFIFFDGEEAFVKWTNTDSIYGARHLANKMRKAKVDVDREVTVNALQTMDLMILLDLIGANNPKFRDFFVNTSPHFQKFQTIEKLLARKGYLEPAEVFQSKSGNTYFIGGRGYGSIQDDHVPFLEKNVPILHLISSPFPDVWHKETDNESALDYIVIDNLNKILRVFVSSYLHL